jgi:hypothetical protein
MYFQDRPSSQLLDCVNTKRTTTDGKVREYGFDSSFSEQGSPILSCEHIVKLRFVNAWYFFIGWVTVTFSKDSAPWSLF